MKILELISRREATEILPGDIIQITDSKHAWFPCLLIIDEVKSWGVQAYCFVPESNVEGSTVPRAFNRLEFGTFELCGMSLLEEAQDE